MRTPERVAGESYPQKEPSWMTFLVEMRGGALANGCL